MRKPLDYSAFLRLHARTWNLAHGRTQPETDESRLEDIVRLVASEDTDVALLQDVPVWALEELERWSGMNLFGVVVMRPYLGVLGRWTTRLTRQRLRSALTGQANAILVQAEHGSVGSAATWRLNARSMRREIGNSLNLDRGAVRQWARNRRMCQLVRADVRGTTIVVANMHLTHFDPRLAVEELARAEAFAAEFAGPGVPILFGGDLNIPGDKPEFFEPLRSAGYTQPAAGIDDLVGKCMSLIAGPDALPDTMREYHGVMLSDHPIIEATFEVGS
jgi:endonuclease/exonuclease/phosphatase family metal-dependent hydrolase